MTLTAIRSGRPVASLSASLGGVFGDFRAPVSGRGAPMTCAVLVIALVAASIAVTPAFAADYQFLNGRTNPHWRADLLAWLAKDKPDPTNVSIGITPDGDVHAYVVPGTFAGIYSVQRLHHPADRADPAFRSMVDGGIGRIIGFGRSKAERDEAGRPQAENKPGEGQGEQGPAQAASPSRFDVYVLTWTKATTP